MFLDNYRVEYDDDWARPMNWLLVFAIVIRLLAAVWSVVLMRRLRDWRVAFLTVVLLLMMVPLGIALWGPEPEVYQESMGFHALVLSIILVLAIVGIGRVFSERNRLIQNLRGSEARYRALAEAAQDVIFVIGRDDRVEYVNGAGARQLRRTPQEVIGRPRTELFPPEVATPQGISLKTVVETKQPMSIESRVMYPGVERWLNTVLVPLLNGNGEVTAVLGVSRDITQRKHAEQELHASRQRLATLSRQLISAQETERRRLAHELHDEIGQVLTGVHLSLQHVRNLCEGEAASRIDDSDHVIQRAITQVRDMSLNLRPHMLDDFGLAAALRWFLERQEGNGLDIHYRCDATGVELPLELKNSCFRVVQEAVTNVQRHARAKNLWVEIDETEHEMRLCIRDDGRGFDAGKIEAQAETGGAFGILGMRERVELHDGRFELESNVDQGTTIRARLPIPNSAPRAVE